MKINKLLLSMWIVPTLSLMGCSDYEDTEVASPQADAAAIGANFSSAATNITVHPDKNKFTLQLNRVNTEKAITVPVTVKSCSEINGVKFCEQPSVFLFAAGQATATVELTLIPACQYQQTYKMELSIGEAKDHPYAAGTSSTVVSVIKDYIWKSLGQPVLIEAGWQNLGALTPVQWASDYTDPDNLKKLFRIEAFYYNAGIASAETSHLQFYLDKATYSTITMFSSTDGAYNPNRIDTSIPVDKASEDAGNFYMNVTNAVRQSKTEYVFTYDIQSGAANTLTTVAAGVTLTLDMDIATAMKGK